jgi:hypothetical protein
MVVTSKESESKINHMEVEGDFNGNVPNLQVFNLAKIEATTCGLSIENKLGEGGYGPVHKVNFSYTAILWHCRIIITSASSLRLNKYAET